MTMTASTAKTDREARLSDKQVHAHCLEWQRWCSTRKFYAMPAAKNILARLQPSRTGEEPNIRNDQDMAFFNMALNSLAEMPADREGWMCFRLMYIEQASHITQLSEKLGISRPTFYARARAFARKAQSFARSLKQIHELDHARLLEATEVD